VSVVGNAHTLTAEASDSYQNTLTIEEKRRVVYASLLRFSPEAGSLRERAVDQIVLGALLGSTEDQPARIGAIRSNLQLGPDAPEIRIETIQESIDRLVQQDKVGHTLVRQRHAYYLRLEVAESIGRAVEESVQLFDSVLARLLHDTDHLVPKKDAQAACRSFICECFARVGGQIAKTVTGQLDAGDLVRLAQIREAFRVAIEGRGLTAEAAELLEARCVSFLKSADPEDERLKLYLTQGFYFAQLLGLEDRPFNPIAEQAFAGAVFYLDTNVVLPRILFHDENAALFDEMIRVARTMGIELRVTRATLDEARSVAADRARQIEKVMGSLPEVLAEKSRDQFLIGYLSALDANPKLTPAEYLEPFDRIADILQAQGIILDDRTADEILAGKTCERESGVFQEEAEKIRGWAKPEGVLSHDLAHYFLIQEQRKTNQKCWFLTRDRTLAQAAQVLSKGSQSSCFSLLGFLQSISPFLISAGKEHSLADLFSSFLTEQVFPGDRLFDIQELNLLAEMHEDVLTTSPEQLVQAVDYVKRTVLHGAPYRASDTPKVALGLKKFLSSSTDERRRALEAETQRLLDEAQQERVATERERELRVLAEDAVRQRGTENHSLSQRVNELEAVADRSARTIQNLKGELDQERQGQRRVWMFLGFIAGFAVWLAGGAFAKVAEARFEWLRTHASWSQTAISAIGAMVFALPSIPFIRHARWGQELKIGASTVVIAVALGAGRLLDPDTWSLWSSLVQIASVAALYAVFALRRQSDR